MRLNEGDEIERTFAGYDLRFIRVNAQERYLAKLKGVTCPDTKRKLIGAEFINVFKEEAAKLNNIEFLAQGTIYLDIAESKSGVKAHHNVGGLPDQLGFELIEPLAELFKDEVRVLGEKLGLPDLLVNRQPFPGPGLAIRVIGEVTESKLEILRAADAIVRYEIENALESSSRPSLYLAVLTDTRSSGVKGGNKTYDPVIAVRAMNTNNFMECEYARLPYSLLDRIASRITSELNISRVVYDITSKPPATMEWE
jgi:GMP synthase (glutamine-hydrolysing)